MANLYNKSSLHLAINLMTQIINKGLFINIQLYSKMLEFSPKGGKGVLILI